MRFGEAGNSRVSQRAIRRVGVLCPKRDRLSLALVDRPKAMVLTSRSNRGKADLVIAEHEIGMNWRSAVRNSERLVKAQALIERAGSLDVSGEQNHLRCRHGHAEVAGRRVHNRECIFSGHLNPSERGSINRQLRAGSRSASARRQRRCRAPALPSGGVCSSRGVRYRGVVTAPVHRSSLSIGIDAGSSLDSGRIDH